MICASFRIFDLHFGFGFLAGLRCISAPCINTRKPGWERRTHQSFVGRRCIWRRDPGQNGIGEDLSRSRLVCRYSRYCYTWSSQHGTTRRTSFMLHTSSWTLVCIIPIDIKDYSLKSLGACKIFAAISRFIHSVGLNPPRASSGLISFLRCCWILGNGSV